MQSGADLLLPVWASDFEVADHGLASFRRKTETRLTPFVSSCAIISSFV
jgi:hypothetical protein